MASPRTGVIQAQNRAATIRKKIEELELICRKDVYMDCVYDELDEHFKIVLKAFEEIEIRIHSVHGEIDAMKEW